MKQQMGNRKTKIGRIICNIINNTLGIGKASETRKVINAT